MGDLARSKGIVSAENERERLLRERLLLEKERELLQRQASEVRSEFQTMKDQYDALKSPAKPRPDSARSRQYLVRDFIDLKDLDGYSSMLRDAIKYFETHDGCPFFGEHCKIDGSTTCRGVWIKMGATCHAFAEGIKRDIKAAIAGSK